MKETPLNQKFRVNWWKVSVLVLLAPFAVVFAIFVFWFVVGAFAHR